MGVNPSRTDIMAWGVCLRQRASDNAQTVKYVKNSNIIICS